MTCGAWKVPHKRELALDLVERGDALTGLQRARMYARINDHLLDGHVSFSEGRIRRGFVAGLPVEDMVVMLARAVRALVLVLDVLADHRRIRRHGFERIDIAGQSLVFDLDQFGGVRRRIAVLGNDESHFLVLEQHLAVGQDHLHVACERRHPGEIHRF